MIALSLAAVLAYSLPAQSKTAYELTVDLDGYLPVLGRMQNKAKVEMTVAVTGHGPDDSGDLKATYEVSAMRASLGGVGLPFSADNVKAYFPKANVTLSALGKVLKSDAPATNLPITLPGLDSKRLPEITFLPLEFPVGAIEVGKPWTFRRKFGDGEIEFVATPNSLDENQARIEVKLASRTAAFEDVSGGAVKLEKDAAARVDTALSGTGLVVFDRRLGQAEKWDAAYSATSTVTDLKAKSTTERILKTKVSVVRRP